MKIYTIVYNEEFLLPYFIKHYKDRFPHCEIFVYDNESTDKTADIAKEMGCTVIPYNTNGQYSQPDFSGKKSTIWKGNDDWTMIVDCDEFCDITEEDIKYEEENGTTVILFDCYSMVGNDKNFNPTTINMGYRDRFYDKSYCFNSKKIETVEYSIGSHFARIEGYVKFSKKHYPVYHYKYLSLEYLLERCHDYQPRLVQEDLQWGFNEQFARSDDDITKEFILAKSKSNKLK